MERSILHWHRLLILTALLSNILLVKGQCGINAACVDCYDWCPTQKNFCANTNLIRDFCRVTCNNCPNSREECTRLNCAQRCVEDESDNTFKCACMEGFELDSDGRSCNDIDECERNSTICDGFKEGAYCNNTRGGYACNSCKAQNLEKIWGYYQRDDCCRRNLTTQCGKSSTNRYTRIVNGRNAKILAWPWMTFLQIGENICGGTLISDNFVLTAAHCLSNILNQNQMNLITILLGVQDINDNTNVNVQTKRAAKITIHPNYSFPDNDIAIVQLDGPAVISQYVSPVCLPNGEEPPIGEVCYATGFGAARSRGTVTPRLQEVDLPIVDIAVCEQAYRNRSNDVNPEIHICAGYEEGGKDACQGDSGGPLVCQRCKNCDWYLAGITSFGNGCARPGFYGVYTRVFKYESWISQITNLPIFTEPTCSPTSWQGWGPWMSCSVTCGIGTRSRVRSCLNGVEGDPGCIGSLRETSRCNVEACSNAGWSTWSEGECSATCGQGTRQKTRTCQNGNIGDEGCEIGSETTTEPCNEVSCPTWSNWNSWSSCSTSCGEGTRQRMRTCNTFGVDGGVCGQGRAKDLENCSNSCWASWGQWGQCTQSCNGGTQMSVRSCLFGIAGTGGCSGNSMRTRSCNEAGCLDWSAWGPCSVTCGNGNQMRVRGTETETRNCNSMPCPTWEPFGPWSSCSESCNGGIEVATRRCRHGNAGDDGCLGTSRKERPCNTFNCNSWTAWTYQACSASCGGGERIGRRQCTGGRVPGIGCLGNATKIEPCNTGCCPSWGAFENYSDCPVTCGGGVQTARRQCNCGSIGEIGCEGSDLRVRECGQSVCPGHWSLWTIVQECSVSCGGGQQRERRECLGGVVGGLGCTEDPERTEECNTETCPAVWGPFGDFGNCSVTCGGGKQTRSRRCIGGEVGTGLCVGGENETRSCNVQSCPGDGPCANKLDVLSNENCCSLVALNYCTTFNIYMNHNCALSCCRQLNNIPCRPSKPGTIQTCFDTNPFCSGYINFCFSPDIYTVCPATCGRC